MPTFAEYLEKWLKQSTAQGLTNPLVKMPVKRFRLLQPDEFTCLANGGSLIIGTMSDPIARNLQKNYQTRIRERGEHCAFVCSGSVEMIVAGGTDGKQRRQLFPVCLKRASFQTSGDKIKAVVAEDEAWQFNPVLKAHLRGLTISVSETLADNPVQATNWVKAQLSNRASQVTSDSYVGLFSSQQMVVQNRLADPPLRQALAKNRLVQAKIDGCKITAELGDITDDGMEGLGLSLPCDDSHPSLQVTKREALAGMIQLKKELKNVPNIPISNWQSLSKERLTKLLGCLGEWPDLAEVLTDNKNIWNKVRAENFDDNPNATNELQGLTQKIVAQIETLQAVREWAAAVGIEMPLNSDRNVADVLALVMSVLDKPSCHPKLIGNEQITLEEVRHLNAEWERREKVIAARHPVPLAEIYSADVKHEAEVLLASEGAKSLKDLSKRETHHTERRKEIEASQKHY